MVLADLLACMLKSFGLHQPLEPLHLELTGEEGRRLERNALEVGRRRAAVPP